MRIMRDILAYVVGGECESMSDGAREVEAADDERSWNFSIQYSDRPRGSGQGPDIYTKPPDWESGRLVAMIRRPRDRNAAI